MKATYVRGCGPRNDANTGHVASLFEIEGGHLPRWVAAIESAPGVTDLYESNEAGEYKVVNALKGSGKWFTFAEALRAQGYVVHMNGTALYPTGHEHAPRLDRKTADAALRVYCEQKELHVNAEFASACAALLRGDAIAFRDRLKDGWMQELRLLRAIDARNGIRDARFAEEASRIANDALVDVPKAGDEAASEVLP